MDVKATVEIGRVPITVLSVTGSIDTSAFEAFMFTAQEAIDNGARYILVDLTNAPYMSSAGLRVLNAVFNKLRVLNTNMTEAEVLKAISDGVYKSPYLKVLNLSKQCRIAFETAGFDVFLETYTDFKTAIASF